MLGELCGPLCCYPASQEPLRDKCAAADLGSCGNGALAPKSESLRLLPSHRGLCKPLLCPRQSQAWQQMNQGPEHTVTLRRAGAVSWKRAGGRCLPALTCCPSLQQYPLCASVSLFCCCSNKNFPHQVLSTSPKAGLWSGAEGRAESMSGDSPYGCSAIVLVLRSWRIPLPL